MSESSSKFLEFTVDNIPSSDLWIKLKKCVFRNLEIKFKKKIDELGSTKKEMHQNK